MTQLRNPRSLRSILPTALFGLASLGSAHAAVPKTLMVLVDFWGQRNQMDTIVNLKVFQPATEIKMVDGQTPPDPALTNAYVNEKFAWWYSLPNFLADDYQKGRIRINTRYQRGWLQNDSNYRAKAGDTIFFPDTQTTFTYWNMRSGANTTVILATVAPKFFVFPDTASYRGPKFYYSAGNSETEILNSRAITSSNEVLPGRIDSCIDLFSTDTIWIRWGTATNPPGQGPLANDMKCFDHNPFNPSRGTLAVFAPWSKAAGWAVVNGIDQPLRTSGRPGWLQTDIWSLPSDASEAVVKFRFERFNGKAKSIVSTDNFKLLYSGATVSNHIMPTMGTHAGFTERLLRDSVVFAWTNPWKSSFARLHFGGDERLDGIWHPEGWYTATIWGRPTKAGLVSSAEDSTTAMLDIGAGTPGTLDTIWLTTRPTSEFKIRLEGNAYDYLLGNRTLSPALKVGPPDSSAYFPFSQSTNSYLVDGLVEPRLGPDGKPRWTKRGICGSGIPDTTAGCKDSANSPDKWFGPVTRAGKSMNASFPISLELSTVMAGALAYNDSLFFPLDSFTTLPGTARPNPFNDSLLGTDLKKHNFGFCIELHGEANIGVESRFTVTSDDDTWIFVDSQLVVDLGGQHDPITRSVSFNNLRRPAPPVVSLDVFHCDRQRGKSSLFLSMNFPVYPVGSIKIQPRVSSLRPGASTKTLLSLQSRSNVLSITAPAGQTWKLELRGLDGKLHQSITGTGPTMVTLTISGVSIALLRSGTETIRGRFVSAR
ncbi:MAG: fibro-slime domain-containing protein [Fibrobacteres bacterium]|nr:fibro-slime domain-containing protein [Fibrobacterota bacterium]